MNKKRESMLCSLAAKVDRDHGHVPGYVTAVVPRDYMIFLKCREGLMV